MAANPGLRVGARQEAFVSLQFAASAAVAAFLERTPS